MAPHDTAFADLVARRRAESVTLAELADHWPGGRASVSSLSHAESGRRPPGGLITARYREALEAVLAARGGQQKELF